MEPQGFILLLLSHFLVVSICAGLQLSRRLNTTHLLLFSLSLAILSIVSRLAFSLGDGTPYIQDIYTRLFIRRDLRDILMACWGAATALPYYGLFHDQPLSQIKLDRSGWISTTPLLAIFLGLFLSLLASSATLVKDVYPEVLEGPSVKDPRLGMEVIGELPAGGVSITTNESGDIFVAYELFKDGREGGGIIHFQRDENTGRYTSSNIMGTLTHPLLARPFGLTTKGDDLYVSRSGRLVRATPHGLVCGFTGSITRISDNDKDGIYETALDVVTGLPGLQLPDTQHGNNGIIFDNDGRLHVLVGSPGDRHIPEYEFEGTVVRYTDTFENPEVIASGFRNPFGITYDRRTNNLFICDQDVHSNPGDEINHVIEGADYGHPYVNPDEDSDETEFAKPIFVGSRESNLAGLASLDSDDWPEDLQGNLLVAEIAGNRILRLSLREHEDGTHVVKDSESLVKIDRPVAIAIGKNSDFFVASREPDNKVYRVYLKQNQVQ